MPTPDNGERRTRDLQIIGRTVAVAALAMAVAIAGSAIAGKGSKGPVSKRAVKKIVNKQITKRSAGLSVERAVTADNAKALDGASLASIATGNDSFTAHCDPETPAYQSCGSVQLRLPRTSKVLLVVGWRWSIDETPDGTGFGRCRTTLNGVFTSGPGDATQGEGLSWDPGQPAAPEIHSHTGGLFDYGGPPIVDVQGPLPRGTHTFGLSCNDELGGDILYSGIRLAAVTLGPG